MMTIINIIIEHDNDNDIMFFKMNYTGNDDRHVIYLHWIAMQHYSYLRYDSAYNWECMSVTDKITQCHHTVIIIYKSV